MNRQLHGAGQGKLMASGGTAIVQSERSCRKQVLAQKRGVPPAFTPW